MLPRGAAPEERFEIADRALALQINTTICAETLPHLEEMSAFIDTLGIVFWEVFFLVPVGRGSVMTSLTAAECEGAFELIYRYLDSKG